LGLLNQARVKIEKIIDILYEPLKGKLGKKPKTYRNLARKNYLQITKKRRPSRKEIRKAIRKQLQYVKRNLSYIDQQAPSRQWLRSIKLHSIQKLTGGCRSLSSAAMDV
jgi:predicted RecB family nuclease